MNLKLPPALQQFVDERYHSGKYATKAEVVYEGLRQLMSEEERYHHKLAALRQAIQEGLSSGPSSPLDIDDIITEASAHLARK